MKRREFIAALGAAALGSWPLAARAQQRERVRRIGVLMRARPQTMLRDRPASRPSSKACSSWAGRSAVTCGSIIRWAAGDADAFANTRPNWSRWRRTSSWPLAASTVAPLLQATRTVPIVFAHGRRSGGRRFRRQPGAAGRQRHRLHAVRIQHGREMAGAAQADRAGRDASGRHSGSGHIRRALASSPRSRPWRRRSGWRSARSTCATPARSSAPSRPSRAPQWRPDRDGERAGGDSSRSDHHAGGPAQAARGLLPSASSSPTAA